MNLANEAVGFLAFATNLGGNLLLTHKNRHGWWIRIVSNAAWFGYSVMLGLFSPAANAVVFGILNVYGWIKWSKMEKANAIQREDSEHDPECSPCARSIPPVGNGLSGERSELSEAAQR